MQYGLVGEKLGHSFSKEIHNELFGYDYVLKELDSNDLDEFFAKRDFYGVNVTIPYKERAASYLDVVSDVASRIGAVNTVVNRNGRLFGDNTDYYGLRALLSREKIDLTGKKVLILGSGGTSKTAFAVASDLGASAYRVSRSGREDCITYEFAGRNHSDAQVIINTTPCGMYPHIDECPTDIALFNNLEAVVDVIYNPIRSMLVRRAEDSGIKAIGGLYMLVAQAAFSAERFTGSHVPGYKIEDIYRRILREKSNIVLIGMPSSGKTTVGNLVAERTGKEFVDTDDEVLLRSGRASVAEIFRLDGESAFRALESQVINEVSMQNGKVIATGGGAVLDGNNVLSLRANGRIFFIDRPLSLLEATSDRPLSDDADKLKKIYENRYNIYLDSCDERIINDTDASTAAEKITKGYVE